METKSRIRSKRRKEEGKHVGSKKLEELRKAYEIFFSFLKGGTHTSVDPSSCQELLETLMFNKGRGELRYYELKL